MEVPDYLYSVPAEEMESMKLPDIEFDNLWRAYFFSEWPSSTMWMGEDLLWTQS